MAFDYTLAVAFSIGMLSTLHCLGMCSGIMGALSFSLPSAIHQNRRRLLPFVLSYNAGRILSYTVAGALSAGLLGGAFDLISPEAGHQALRLLAGTVLLGIGLYLAGWFPLLAAMERVGRPLWQFLEPVGRRLLPVRTPTRAVLFGAVWGWLPCGLVYSTLLWAAASGSAIQGASLMLAFGLGTLPTTVAAGILTSWVARIRQQSSLRRGAGVAMIVMALGSVAYGFTPGHDHEKQQFSQSNVGRHMEHENLK